MIDLHIAALIDSAGVGMEGKGIRRFDGGWQQIRGLLA